jgi:hypothetical protein
VKTGAILIYERDGRRKQKIFLSTPCVRILDPKLVHLPQGLMDMQALEQRCKWYLKIFVLEKIVLFVLIRHKLNRRVQVEVFKVWDFLRALLES